MAAPKPIDRKQMAPVIASHLSAMGFWLMHRSRTGSRYLRLPDAPFEIRLSDHKWGGFSKMRHMQVIKSVVLRPVPASETWLLAFDLAIRFAAACNARQRPKVWLAA